jgi:hypothetical protein
MGQSAEANLDNLPFDGFLRRPGLPVTELKMPYPEAEFRRRCRV